MNRKCRSAAWRASKNKRALEWRQNNFGRWKLMQMPAYDGEKRQAERKAFVKGHVHKCLRCREPYKCTNACEMVGEGLKVSICDACFEREAMKPCSTYL